MNEDENRWWIQRQTGVTRAHQFYVCISQKAGGPAPCSHVKGNIAGGMGRWPKEHERRVISEPRGRQSRRPWEHGGGQPLRLGCGFRGLAVYSGQDALKMSMQVRCRCKWLCPGGKCGRKTRVTAGTLFLPAPLRCPLNHDDGSLGSELSPAV